MIFIVTHTRGVSERRYQANTDDDLNVLIDTMLQRLTLGDKLTIERKA